MNHKFALEHVGINCANPEEAAELAQLLSTLFNLNPRHGNKSEFGGDYFECMKTPSSAPMVTSPCAPTIWTARWRS